MSPQKVFCLFTVVATFGSCFAYGKPEAVQVKSESALKGVVLKAVKNRPADAVEFNGSYYKVFEIIGTWPQAEKRCREMGGILASVKTKKANDFIDELTGKKCYWVGGNDRDQEGEWRWMDGSKTTYVNWSWGEPDDGGGAEDAMVYSWRGQGLMCDARASFDGKGGRIRGFICEWKNK